jgi:hypothetical protein
MARTRSRKCSLVVASGVRRLIRDRECFAGSDLLAGLDEAVRALLVRAAERARLNKRRTVRRCDL